MTLTKPENFWTGVPKMCVNLLYDGISVLRLVGLDPKPAEVPEDFSGDWNMFPSSPTDLHHPSFSFFINFFFIILY